MGRTKKKSWVALSGSGYFSAPVGSRVRFELEGEKKNERGKRKHGGVIIKKTSGHSLRALSDDGEKGFEKKKRDYNTGARESSIWVKESTVFQKSRLLRQ